MVCCLGELFWWELVAADVMLVVATIPGKIGGTVALKDLVGKTPCVPVDDVVPAARWEGAPALNLTCVFWRLECSL